MEHNKNMQNDPIKYFPVSPKPFEFQTGLRLLKGSNSAKDNIFQIDNQWQEYHKAKTEARAEQLDKYICDFKLSPAVASRVTLYLLNQLANEYPEQFQLQHSESSITLNCRLSGDQLCFNQSLELTDNAKYKNALDALCCQIQEDIAIVELHDHQDVISYLHLCFPNHWAAEDKIGHSFLNAHMPVPDMDKINQQSKKLTDTFIRKGPFERFTWGIATDDRLNHHPVAPNGIHQHEWHGRAFNPTDPKLYLRIERQTTIGLAEVGTFIFTIRTYHRNVSELTQEERSILIRAIQTMPDTIKRYKGLDIHSESVCQYLAALH